jgi:hypothetical protein
MSTPRASWLRAFAARLRGFVPVARQDDGFDEELQEHLRLLAERFMAQGMSREDAAAAARRQFGNSTLLQEDRRALQTFPSVDALGRDLRYALRMPYAHCGEVRDSPQPPSRPWRSGSRPIPPFSASSMPRSWRRSPIATGIGW